MLKSIPLRLFRRSASSASAMHRGSILSGAAMQTMMSPQIGWIAVRFCAGRVPTTGNARLDALDADIRNVRNIGIVAHIDAGKTTTTERMLFYAGVTKRVGDVDSGTTTTDYMQEEMDRGITITSAAVSLSWKKHHINLIDTPGHVDFTVEVERALRVVDGVVALFDASAGVQAQSYTVLRQARKFQIPVVAFLNKMDKPNANFTKSVASIRDKLNVEPLVVQLPLHGEDGAFEGVIDLVSMEALHFVGKHGSDVNARVASEALPEYMAAAATQARHLLLSQLSARDDALSESLIMLLEKTDGDETKAEALLPAAEIRAAIRRHSIAPPKVVTSSGREGALPLVPVLCGASRRDQGVQPLLDAVNSYLPSPLDRTSLTGFSEDRSVVPLPKPTNHPSARTIALAFKVIHQLSTKSGRYEPLVFFRVYNGKITPRMRLTNYSSKERRTETFERLYVMHANNPVEVPMITAGNIGAAFLTHTCTGDTLIGEPSVNFMQQSSSSSKEDPASSKKIVTLEGIQAPPAAISYAIEAANAKQISLLDEALAALQKEDPSLRTTKNDFGQLILSGMGELHLEIIMSRLEREYQLKCTLLRAVIEYRETLATEASSPGVTVHSATGELPVLEVDLEWLPMMADGDGTLDALSENEFEMTADCESEYISTMLASRGVQESPDGRANSSNGRHLLDAKEELLFVRNAFREALADCCKMGPLAALPMLGVKLVMTRCRKRVLSLTDKTLTAVAVRNAVSQELRHAITNKKDGKLSVAVLEPMMHVEVHLTESTYIGDVISSLNEKNAVTVDILDDGRSVSAVVPMRNIVRYTTDLRKSAKGNANFFARLVQYRVIEDRAVLSRVLKNLGVVSQQ